MRLFVWNNPYRVSYGSSLVFAVAETLEEARAIAQSRAAAWYAYGVYPDGSPPYTDNHVSNTSRESAPMLGEPTRIVDIPCSEWHRWEE